MQRKRKVHPAVDLLRHHIPIAAGAMVAVLVVAGVEKLGTTHGQEKRNLYVVHSPCMKAASDVRIYNTGGDFRITNLDGVVVNPPLHWTMEGSTLRAILNGEVHILNVERGGVLRIPGSCTGVG